tara:strand:+ start:170 stop:292 length:123 start_codon:yes stop_codon:yes gene_type:complete
MVQAMDQSGRAEMLHLSFPGQVRENDTKNIEREEMRVIEW